MLPRDPEEISRHTLVQNHAGDKLNTMVLLHSLNSHNCTQCITNPRQTLVAYAH